MLPPDTRLVFDTNVLLSAFVFKKFAGEVYEYCAEHCVPFTSDWILDELNEKLEQKFKLPPSLCQEITDRIRSDAQVSLPTNPLPTDSPDPDDNHVLRLALFVEAQFLITGDKEHLLPLKQVGLTEIISPREFYERYIA
ncbi:putative toxin-antitoxin system toxin component, PIN family [Rudanella lutea]|uniref:putative toxin-antitoxin system toxin component, PIN family n=1 Tax=Rudanella lutea TaxID=451374 RepID=UPI000368D5AF|nr:putative toxin-antitoxin system toxin component, PIN family [Rudanella lutea]